MCIAQIIQPRVVQTERITLLHSLFIVYWLLSIGYALPVTLDTRRLLGTGGYRPRIYRNQ